MATMDQNDRDLTLLRSEIENLRFIISTQAQRESTAIKWFGVVGGMFVAVFTALMALSFYSGYDSTKKIEESAKEILLRADKRVEDLVGSVAPSAAWIDNRYGDNSGQIIGTAYLYESKEVYNGKPRIFSVGVAIPFRIHISSTSTAKVLGYEWKLSKDLGQLMHEGAPQDTMDEVIRQDMNYTTETLQNGMIISPNAGINQSFTYIKSSLSCNEVEKKFEELIQSKTIGTITLRPVLEMVSDQTDIREETFRLSFVHQSLYEDCKELMKSYVIK